MGLQKVFGVADERSLDDSKDCKTLRTIRRFHLTEENKRSGVIDGRRVNGPQKSLKLETQIKGNYLGYP